MAKMCLEPPKRTAEDFIRSAGQPNREEYPWEDPKVRKDVIKSVNLRLSEPYLLKLHWLSEKTRKSQQEIIREALLPYLDAEIEQIKD